MLLKPIEAWLQSARVPNILPMSTSLTFIVLGSILWSKMAVTKRLFLWPKIGQPVYLMIKKSVSKFRAYISLGLKVTRTMAITQKRFLVLPSWLNCSLTKPLSKRKLSVFIATGPMLKKMPMILLERSLLANITITMIQNIQLA